MKNVQDLLIPLESLEIEGVKIPGGTNLAPTKIEREDYRAFRHVAWVKTFRTHTGVLLACLTTDREGSNVK